MGDEDPHPVERCEMVAQIPADTAPCPRIERGQRFIEQQHTRVRCKRSSERSSLGLTARQGPRSLVGVFAEADAFEPLAGDPAGICLRGLAGPESVGDVFEHAHVFEQQVVLEHESDRSHFGFDEDVGRRVVDDGVVDRDAAAVDRGESGQAAQHRALAGPVRAEQRQELAGLHVEICVQVERAEPERELSRQGHAATAEIRWSVRPNHRSRSPTSTANEIAISSSASTIASSGLVSSER